MVTLKHSRLTTGYKVGYNNENSQKKKLTSFLRTTSVYNKVGYNNEIKKKKKKKVNLNCENHSSLQQG
jgi:hypothetical protein